ncbi:hypothetical protein KQI77_05130 [Clostridium sp. MSJ-8]|uniref:hypothetical protein n=1 Tax=Clostridium sp. MSJ-8 TaxID=2841510 RepID=UPI001C0EE2D3|nr:hypothetical protein [Clostridium sp. MSJ-8]MBU5487545.1 hypothetical protein [Clostridium sp. MSJ-8]
MKKGYILIEIIISIMILTIGITMALSGYTSIIKSIREREINRRLKDDLYSICMEIRYNETLSSLKDSLIDGTIYIEYGEKFSEIIKTKSLLDVKKGKKDNYIKISKLSESDTGLKINVSIVYEEECISVDVIKDEWMDE